MVVLKVGVIADDLTGSNDIGSMFGRAGYTADVYSFENETEQLSYRQGVDVCILNTASRLDPPALTYTKVAAATRALADGGCSRFFAKTSSAFVGPVGAQFDAVLDTAGQEFAVVVAAFPANGRITRDGVHLVHGKPLAESEFRNDPAHPMACSNLVDILQAQTRRRVTLADHRTIARSAQALRQRLEELRGEYSYVVLDVLDQPMLQIIAEAVRDIPVICGSSALAEELPAFWGPPNNVQNDVALPEPDELGVLCAAGSLMPQTVQQIRHLKSRGVATFQLNTLALFGSRARQAEVDRLIDSLTCRLRHGQSVVVHSPNRRDQVERTRAAGARHGQTEIQVARLVSETLAQIVAETRSRSGVSRIVIAGGETSSAVCSRLGVHAFRVYREIQPGLPSCLALDVPPLLLVLKSGSFGTPDFIEAAIAHLQGLAA